MNTVLGERRDENERLAAGNMAYKNIGFEIFAEKFGEDELKKRLEDELKPLPLAGHFDKLQLHLKTQTMKGKVSVGAMLRYFRRPSHTFATGAVGVAQIVQDPTFPEHDFFEAGREFSVRLRHGNYKYEDDAACDYRSFSLKFADSDDDSPLDVLMNTGEACGFWNVPSFEDAMGLYEPEETKKHMFKNPYYYYNVVDGLRRAPDSYAHLSYYSQVCFLYNAKDGKRRYCKYRAIPSDVNYNEPEESGRLTEKDQREAWLRARHEDEKRPIDYLKQEYIERLQNGPVRYRLQIQIHMCSPTDPDTIFHAGIPWEKETHPWLELAEVTMTTLLSPDVLERTRFCIANHPDSIEVLEAQSLLDYNSIGHLREAVYPFVQRVRGAKYGFVAKTDVNTPYTIEIETGEQANSGTNASITIRLTGSKGRTDYLSLDKWFHNDFKTGQTGSYTVNGFDVGDIHFIELHSNQGGGFWQNPDWFVNKVTITSQDKVHNFPCYKWVADHLVVFHGKATLPFYEVPAAVSQERQEEIRDRKKIYQWDRMSPELPGVIKAATHDDLPKDVQFTDENSRCIAKNRKQALYNLGVGKFLTLFEDWDEYDDFKILYRERFLGTYTVYEDKWMDDRWFAYQFLNGANPAMLYRCTSLPDNFPVTDEHVGNLLDRGRSLQKEIKEGHIYMVDFKMMEGAQCYGGPILEDMGYSVPAHANHDTADMRYCSDPLALFYVNKSGHLMPLAIQIRQTPAPTNPIWTPNEPNEHDWVLAKLWLRVADTNYHQLTTHFLRTHLTTEAFAVATWRNLPSSHPVFKLLQPHMYGVLAINTIARDKLIAPGGTLDVVLSLGGGGHVKLIEKCYKSLNLQEYVLPKSLKRRGIDDVDKLPGFYYRDDGLKLWGAVEDFVREIIGIYYKNDDDDVKRDNEIQDWILDLHENGWVVNEGDDDHGIPRSIEQRDQLIEILTALIFTFSCQHAAVNFSQKDYYGFTPNAPAIMRQPPPTEKGQATLQSILQTLPNKSQAARAITTIHVLTTFSEDERYLGNFTSAAWGDVEALQAVKKFQEKLEEISEEIKKRNENLEIPYIYLLPERIPNGIAI